MYEFKLPDVGEGIHEAELIEWLVEVGTHVDEGSSIAVVNTDKVSVELPSPVAGTIAALPWQPGDIVHVGDVLVVIAAEESASPVAPEAIPAGPSAVPAATGASVPSVVPAPIAAIARAGRVVAAPSTRKYAVERGVDLETLAGTGPGGRILRSDVDAVLSRQTAPAGAPTPAMVSDREAGRTVRREPLAGARSVMFRHMAKSSGELATSTSTFTVRMEAVEELVRELRSGDPTEQRSGPRVGVLSVAAACVTRALERNARLNATTEEGSSDLLLHEEVHLGIAVASPSGLVVPVIRNATSRRLSEIASAIDDLATRAREGTLAAADLRGGTFTLSSTGGLERSRVTSTQPIVNLPQVAIMWMSRVRDEPVIEDGLVRAGRLMSCSVSFDHRYVDGAEITAFINDVTELFEHPLRSLA